MFIRLIRTDEDHAAALARAGVLWGAALGTPEGDELDALATLIDAYERRRWPIPKGDPVEAILGAMEWGGRTRADLAEVLGSASRASEIMNRKRRLTTAMIRRLHEAWRIPLELLVEPYALAGEPRVEEAADA